ncbi:lysozyme C-1 [Trichonephila inaurata madagascariensis]|uniref:Lysozyme C-1 n=1 Tax=Trichonephila inaurata madagascariensis TaxID=2747483 RepID=A0A8X6WM79_9ARAC|nr:lysozyme C-1 [Trichonephila inaurata madagascariensis]
MFFIPFTSTGRAPLSVATLSGTRNLDSEIKPGLRDDDISDDVACLQHIIKEKGFHEWMSYGLRCNRNTNEYLQNCDLTSRALNVGMKLNYHPQPFVRFNIKHVTEQPNLVKIRLGLTSQPKGFKVNVNAKEAKFNFFSKFLGAHYKIKPFFSMHQYVTR